MSTIRANVGGGNVTGRMRGGNLDLQIVPWLNYSVPGVANLLVLSATTLLSIYCYICCVIADPGRVPPDYQPDLESPSGIVQVKKNGTTRFCQKCKNYKPPRCHHCRVCQKCVLRMDHHCPWINNCVGHYNYRVFLLFLIYVNAALVHAVGLLVTHALHVIRDRSGPDGFRGVLHRVYDADDLASSSNRPFIWAMVQTLAMSLAIPLELGLLMLLCWHAYLSLENKTTIEYHEGVTATLRASRQGRLYRHPYNMGVVNNLHAILGPHLLCWLIPGQLSVEGVGLKYTTRMELGNFDALVPDGKQPDSAPPSLAAAVMRPGASGMASQAFPSSPLKTS